MRKHVNFATHAALEANLLILQSQKTEVEQAVARADATRQKINRLLEEAGVEAPNGFRLASGDGIYAVDYDGTE